MVKNKPFWEIINKASENTAEIRIYGDIVSEKPWYDSSGDVCPIGFADALAKLEAGLHPYQQQRRQCFCCTRHCQPDKVLLR